MPANTFKITMLDYDLSTDTLRAAFYLSRSCLAEPHEPDADPADSLEKFQATYNFSSRRCEIFDCTDHAGDVELAYPPQVLSHFMLEWERAFRHGDNDDPASVALDTFDVPIAF